MASDVSRDLKKLSKSWAKTEAKQGGGGGGIPDGEYTLSLKSMEVKHSKNGRLQVVSSFSIVSPKKMKGKDKLVFHGLENENNIAYFKGYAEVIGLELPDDMEDLPDALQSFVEDNEDDITVKFVTNKDGYQNMTIIAVGDNELESEEDKDSEDDGEDSEEDNEEEDSEEDSEEDEDSEEEDSEEEDSEEEEDEDKPKRKKKEKKVKKEKKKKKKSRR